MTAKRVAKGHFSIANANPEIRTMLAYSGVDILLAADSEQQIEHTLREVRSFPPPDDFARRANLKSQAEYELMYRESIESPDTFWAERARQHLVWFAPWQKTLDWSLPDARWFTGGPLNACFNCLDRHLDTPVVDKAALIWEGEPEGERRTLTCRELHRETCCVANVLKAHGIGKGDRVIIYMPMAPESVMAMLACARVGAIHSVVFGGFSAQAVADRVHDCGARLIITADGVWRRGAVVPLKASVDAAFEQKDAQGRPLCETVEHVLAFRRTGNPVSMRAGRDLWRHEAVARVPDACDAEAMDSEDPLFILYTSGSTGKPKGIFHTTAGYLLGTKLTHHYIFDLRDDDVFWCTADIGWITGHSYVVYGPLANGATVLMYEDGYFWIVGRRDGDFRRHLDPRGSECAGPLERRRRLIFQSSWL